VVRDAFLDFCAISGCKLDLAGTLESKKEKRESVHIIHFQRDRFHSIL